MRHLVVAKYKEDTGWTKDFPEDVFIVEKDVHLPNAGREPSSYFWYIASHYNDIKPEDIYIFVQGNPFPHDIDLMTHINKKIRKFTYLGDAIRPVDKFGNPDHPNLDVKGKFEEWTGRKWGGAIKFSPGAQFMVTGKELKYRPKKWYLKLMDDFTTGYNPYIAERLFGYLWRKPKQN